jgi:hypothetical protein
MEPSLVNRKPITPKEHCLIDYFQSAFLIAAPALFGLSGVSAKLVLSFGLVQAVTNALSDTPVGVYRLIPMPVHGSIEKWGGPACLAIAFLSDGARQQNARFLLFHGLLATTIYNLTDYNRNPDS